MTMNKSYFRRLIKGEISLFITFWIWFIFVSLLSNIFFGYNFGEQDIDPTSPDKIIDFLIYSIRIIYTIFIFIAIIRSANKYLGSKIWGYIAKIMVTLNLMISLFALNDIARIYFIDNYMIKSELNKLKEKLPIKVNSYTQLQNINIIDNNIYYIYQINNIDILKNTIPRLNRFKKQIQESICEDENHLKLLKKGYTLNYNYVDNKGSKFLNIITDVASCGKSVYDIDILKEVLKAQGQM